MRRETGADPESAGAERELERRLTLATPADSVRGMFFRSVLEVMRELGDMHAVERCVEACGERKFVDFSCYPTSSFLRLLGTSARLLGTGYGDFEGALRALGRRGATDFFASSTGRPLWTMLSGNPKRMVDNLPMAYAMASANGGQCLVTWVSSRQVRILLDRDFLPCAYVEGALTAALEVLGTRDPRVRSRSLGPLGCEYSLTWL
ncbi:TIGR02265 family protein [Archangium sp.]|uniref:TIGR02265 family protein n=1 Tax=Archangium sp. TaxID=1872627 RepID=UPI00389AB28A